MKQADKVKFVSEVEMRDESLEIRQPFKIEKDERRRFIRLEISAPVWLKSVKDGTGRFNPDGDGAVLEGTVLNVSAGGVLVDLDTPITAREIVLMRFTLQDVEMLDNVLGVVKRVEEDEAEHNFLAGIEFVSRDNLRDILAQGEIDLLNENVRSFDEKIHEALSRYLYRESEDRKDG